MNAGSNNGETVNKVYVVIPNNPIINSIRLESKTYMLPDNIDYKRPRRKSAPLIPAD